MRILSLLITGLFAVCQVHAEPGSLRFHGGKSENQADRVIIEVDDPSNDAKGPPADVGEGDFTIELWLKADANNLQPDVECKEYDFVLGNIIVDRDRYNQGQAFGLSLTGGKATFSAQTANYWSNTVCGTTDLRDSKWHHVAIQRKARSGELSIVIDGKVEARAEGPSGNIAYPDSGRCDDMSICSKSDPYLVIGAEKHDLAYGFSGHIAQIRISDTIRFPGESVSGQPMQADKHTQALYSFFPGQADSIDELSGSGQGPAVRLFGTGSSGKSGPVYESDHPFE